MTTGYTGTRRVCVTCLDLDLYIAGTILAHFCNGAARAQCK